MADFTFTITVGGASATETLNVPDAKAVEFLDLLRTRRYSSAGVNVPTRPQAAQRYARELSLEPVTLYRRLKEEVARIERQAPPDYDLRT